MRIVWILLLICGSLIGYFVLSAALSKPSSMTYNVPDSSTEEPTVDARKTLILFVGSENTYLLDRVSPNAANAASVLKTVPNASLQQAVKQLKQRAELTIGKDSLVVIIKTLPASTYKNLHDALDMMAILSITL